MHASSKNTNASPDDGNDDFEWFKNQQNLQKPAFETIKSDDNGDSKQEFENKWAIIPKPIPSSTRNPRDSNKASPTICSNRLVF